jgi:hypothetical protein
MKAYIFNAVIAMALVTRAATIQSVYVDVSRLHHDARSNGDTWDYIWADDDNLYSFACDGKGYGTEGRNLNFNILTGTVWDALSGALANPMDYGKTGEKWPNQSNWKVTGGDCIDGVLYAFVANNWYGNQNAFGGDKPDSNIRQTVNNMSLIKSTDHGKTWSRDTQTNYDRPMWNSRKFSTGFFFKYGQNGGATKQDDADHYVYVISNDGYWNCGADFYLGRVLRSKIGGLNAADWQYFSNGRWSPHLDDATPVPGFPNGQMKCTGGSPIWIADLGKYVTVTWFDPGTNREWHYPENVTFAFYQADHPWGPWAYIGEKSCCDFMADRRTRISRWYGPSLSDRFLVSNPDGSATATLTFSGQIWDDKPSSLYKNNSCPVTFFTRPEPKEVRNYNDTAASYSNGWVYESHRGVGDYQDDAHVTSKFGQTAEFTFKGTGIEILSEKFSSMGPVEVILDGISRGVFDLYQDPMPRLYQVEFFRAMNLPNRSHTVRVINQAADGRVCIIDGFRVYGAMDFDARAEYQIANRATGEPLYGERNWKIKGNWDGTYSLSGENKAFAVDERWKINHVGNGTFSIVDAGNELALTGDPQTTERTAYLGRDVQRWEIFRDH